MSLTFQAPYERSVLAVLSLVVRAFLPLSESHSHALAAACVGLSQAWVLTLNWFQTQKWECHIVQLSFLLAPWEFLPPVALLSVGSRTGGLLSFRQTWVDLGRPFIYS